MHIGFALFADFLVAGVAVCVVRVALRVLTNEKLCHAAPPVLKFTWKVPVDSPTSYQTSDSIGTVTRG